MDPQHGSANHVIDVFCEHTIAKGRPKDPIDRWPDLSQQLPETVGVEDPNSKVA